MALFFEFDFFIKSCRHFIGILAWTWAILVFCLSYIGRGNYQNNNNYHFGGGGPPTFYQAVFVPILKVLLVAPSSLAGPIPAPAPEPHQAVVVPWGQGLAIGASGEVSPGGFIYCAGCSPISPQQFVLPSNIPVEKTLPAIHASGVLPPEQRLNGLAIDEPGQGTKIWDDGSVPVQKMALHDDGRYSFSYDTAHSSRQEERNLDGSVQGSYSYTDPNGKLVQIAYTAGPNKGYTAFGENVPPQSVLQLPQPVHDTPEVQEARQRFLETYAAELARIEQEQKEAAEKAADGEGDSTVAPSNDDDTVVVSSQNQDEVAGAEAVQETDDALVISGKSEVNDDAQKEASPQQNVPENNQEGSDDPDSVVISADDNDTPQVDTRSDIPNQDQVQDSKVDASSLPSPSYQITIPIGIGPNSGLSVQPSPIAPQVHAIHSSHPVPALGLPQPVIDTPEVQRARQEFLDTYNKELERIQKAHQEALEKAKNSQISEVENKNDIDSNTNNANDNNNNVASAVDAKSNLQPYFYYVSVGGQPHYVTSVPQPGYSSPYPTSLKATLLGAIPLAAVHDSQVPNRGKSSSDPVHGQTISGAEIRPVFLDLENSVNQNQQTSLNNENQQTQQQQQATKNNPIVGQLVPLSLTPVNTGSGVQIGYIVLNNNAQGSQSEVNGAAQAVPVTLSLNVPQQQQNNQNLNQATISSNQASPALSLSQPVILLASKK